MGNSQTTQKMLNEIDNSENGKCDEQIEKLFKKFDKDNSGMLQGKEYTSFIDDVVEYSKADLKKLGHDLDEQVLKPWVQKWVDPNGDNKISLLEIKQGLKHILNKGEQPSGHTSENKDEKQKTGVASSNKIEELCGGCGNRVEGSKKVALEKSWHPKCFKCAVCYKEIQEGIFAVIDGKPTHDGCRPKDMCTKCHTLIDTQTLRAFDKSWHPQCFTCYKCKKPIADATFCIENDDPLHNECRSKLPCALCNELIDGQLLTAMEKNWHPKCFTCHKCHKCICSTFYPKEGFPYCSVECLS